MKNSLIIVVFLFAGLALRAQKTDVHFGLKAGLNIANLNVKDASGYDSKASFYAGGLAHIHVTQHFAIQPEVMYSGQGGKTTIAGTDYKVNLNYINVPVLGQYMTGGGFRLQTGPQVGFLTTAKSKVNDDETNIKDNFKTTDFSWVFGASYQTHSGFGVDGRYNLGLSDISESNASKVRNRVVQLGVFYQFMHNK